MTGERIMKRLSMLAMLALAAAAFPTMAHAASQPFDVEQATRAYLDLLGGPARAKSDAYFEGGYWLLVWGTLVSVLSAYVLLYTGWAAGLRAATERVVRWRWLVPGVYAIPFTIVSALLTLPWTIYTDFVREKQYGLMNQGFGDWMIDQGKALLVAIVLSAFVFIILFAVIRRFRRSWWALGAITMALFAAFGALIYPVYIAPMFNSYTEMPAGPLRDRIVTMAQANHIPAQHIYVSDASRQSKRISANVSGLGPTIRITLNDNLLKRTGPDEVAAVMGHEMGHYVLGHIPRSIGLITIIFLLIFFAIARIAPAMIARHPRWGIRDIADPAAITVLVLLASVGTLILNPALKTITRVSESEADRFGLDAAREPDGFAKTAMRLSEYRKIEPGPWEEALFFDHPSGATRVRMAMQWKKDHVPGATMVKPDIKLDGTQ